LTVSANAPLPTFTETGLKPVMVALATLNLEARVTRELTPSAVLTVTGYMPAVAR
jgi:hypothetical protein